MHRLTFAAAISLLATCPAAAQPSVEDALAPYYAGLLQEMELPRAPAGAALPDRGTAITRFAFGSCNRQDGDQDIWASIAATDPQLFLLIGDNVYGDPGWEGDAALGSLRAAYAMQSGHAEFADFRARVPMLATWDDHDFGWNDGGAGFSPRRWAETIFETYWGASEAVRAHPGVHDSMIFGPEGERLQVIMLDTRFFRSALRRPAAGEQGPASGRYLPDTGDAAQMLGEEQWQWLEAELARPADLRIIVSSIQVLTDAHGWEAWATMPRQRERLFDLLGDRAGGGVLMLSGDRHAAGIYAHRPAGRAEQYWEVTSSSLNASHADTATATAREPDDRRVTPMIGEENFATIDIDWRARRVSMTLRDDRGGEVVNRSFGWTGPEAQAALSMPRSDSLR